MNYAYFYLLSFAISVLLVPLVKKLAHKSRAIDVPGGSRKLHPKPTPLLGGVAVFLGFSVSMGLYLLTDLPNFSVIPLKFFLALFFGGAVLMAGGFLDDRFRLPAKVTWIFPTLAALIVVMSGIGIGIRSITNPFGGNISLDLAPLGLPISGIFSFFWIIGMTYTTKILDGMDGLVSGVGIIGALTLFFLSLTDKVNQPMTAMLAIILAGSLLGFLIYNFHPASIFLGEGGSTLVGFILGVLSIILGGKIATALLVMGIPILDVAWAILRRVFAGVSPFVGDRQHLHFRLLDIGLNPRQAAYVLWGISLLFGISAVFLQSKGKLIALIVLFGVMVSLVMLVVYTYKKKIKKEQPDVA